jgi:UDP-N-acetylmuramate dehydrogenase
MTDYQEPTIDCLAADLAEALGPEKVRTGQDLVRYTALRIGGPADLLVTVENARALQQAVKLAWHWNVPVYVLGSGTNVLISDLGIRGLVVLNRARNVSITKDEARAESGASLSTIARQSIAQGLAGLEWAIGIPGTVGGAVVGNAGAWGSDTASSVVQATVLEENGEAAIWPVDCFGYGYRSSVIKRQALQGQRQAIVLEAIFALQPSRREALEAKAREITNTRKATQPPGASCGSVFKNPPGDHAGRLIDAAGLKGTRVGQATISTVHANFIVNEGTAQARDVQTLIDAAREKVLEDFGIELELEIELLGESEEHLQIRS